jgi:hypothetical protein
VRVTLARRLGVADRFRSSPRCAAPKTSVRLARLHPESPTSGAALKLPGSSSACARCPARWCCRRVRRARAPPAASVVGWGLAQAFLALGSESVAAPARRVNDTEAFELQHAVYAALQSGLSLREAFWSACHEQADPKWRAFASSPAERRHGPLVPRCNWCTQRTDSVRISPVAGETPGKQRRRGPSAVQRTLPAAAGFAPRPRLARRGDAGSIRSDPCVVTAFFVPLWR